MSMKSERAVGTYTKMDLIRAGCNTDLLPPLFDDPDFDGKICYQVLLDVGFGEFDTRIKKFINLPGGVSYDDIKPKL